MITERFAHLIINLISNIFGPEFYGLETLNILTYFLKGLVSIYILAREPLWFLYDLWCRRFGTWCLHDSPRLPSL